MAALRLACAALASLPVTGALAAFRALGGGQAWPRRAARDFFVPAALCGLIIQGGGAVREGLEREGPGPGGAGAGAWAGAGGGPSPWRAAVAWLAAVTLAPEGGGTEDPLYLASFGLLLAGTALAHEARRRARGEHDDALLYTFAPDRAAGVAGGADGWSGGAPLPDWSSVQRMVRHSLANDTSRRILLFLGISALAMVLEFVGGIFFNSLSLVSDGFHMLFDCSALALGLCASYVSKHFRPDEGHTFGYGRSEVLSGFVNAVTLVLTAVLILFEAFERFMRPPDVRGPGTLVAISVVGLAVNLVGLVFFSDDHAQEPPASPSAGRRVDYNLRALFVHALADTLGSVGVIASALAIKYWGWTLADPACSAVVAFTVVASILPVIRSTSRCLFQQDALPARDTADVWFALGRLPSVAHVSDLRIWALTPQGRNVAVLHLALVPGTPPEHVDRTRSAARKVLRDAGVDETTIEVHAPGPPEPAAGLDDPEPLLVIPLTPPQMVR